MPWSAMSLKGSKFSSTQVMITGLRVSKIISSTVDQNILSSSNSMSTSSRRISDCF